MKKTVSLLTEPRQAAWVLLLFAAACTPPPRWIAVGGGEDPQILLLNPDLSVADTVSLPATEFSNTGLHSVQVGRDGVSLYVADLGGPGTGRISRIRRLDGQLLDSWHLPRGAIIQLTVLLDSPTLVVTVSASGDTGPGSFYYLSTDLLIEKAPFEPCIGNPRGFAILQEIGRGYTRCNDDGEPVVDLDLTQQRIVRTVTLDRDEGSDDVSRCGPGGIALSRTGGILLAPCSLSGQLLYLDRLTLEVLDSVMIGTGASQITVSPRGSQALVTIPDSNAVAIADLRQRSVSARVQLPDRPVAVVVSGDGKRGYVLTAGHPATVVLLDLRRNLIQGTAVVPAGSTSLSIWPGQRSPSMRWR